MCQIPVPFVLPIMVFQKVKNIFVCTEVPWPSPSPSFRSVAIQVLPRLIRNRIVMNFKCVTIFTTTPIVQSFYLFLSTKQAGTLSFSDGYLTEVSCNTMNYTYRYFTPCGHLNYLDFTIK